MVVNESHCSVPNTRVLHAQLGIFIMVEGSVLCIVIRLLPFSDLIGPRGSKFVSFHRA